MRTTAVLVLVLLGLTGAPTAAGAAPRDPCTECRDQQRACMSNYDGPTCKTEYDRCVKSCRQRRGAGMISR